MIGYIISAVSVAIACVSLLVSAKRARKEDLVQLEHRLTKLESMQDDLQEIKSDIREMRIKLYK